MSANTLQVVTTGLNAANAPLAGYSPIPPSPTSPSPSQPLMSVSSPIASPTSTTRPLYPNVNMGIGISQKHVIYKNVEFTDADRKYFSSLYGTIIEYGTLYYNYTTITDLNTATNFDCLLLNMADPQTHAWVEVNYAALKSDTYFTIYLYKKIWWVSIADATEALAPSVIIQKLDPTITSGEVWMQSLLKKELPKLRKGLSGFFFGLTKTL